MDGTHPCLTAAPTSSGPRHRTSHALRPAEEWIPVPVPAIIDLDTWRLAQEQLARNQQLAKRNNTRHSYLLSALLICNQCGRRMIGTADGDDQRRYVCSARYPRHARGACNGRSITAAPLEAQVWQWTANLRIPMHSAHPYRFQTAHRSNLKSPTVPISNRPPF